MLRVFRVTAPRIIDVTKWIQQKWKWLGLLTNRLFLKVNVTENAELCDRITEKLTIRTRYIKYTRKRKITVTSAALSRCRDMLASMEHKRCVGCMPWQELTKNGSIPMIINGSGGRRRCSQFSRRFIQTGSP